MNAVVILVLVAAAVTIANGKTQNICVKGKLTCSSNEAKAQNIKIKLMDKNSCEYSLAI